MSSLPAKKLAININLLPQDPIMDGIVGKFLIWSLSIGRYIVVLTELIVILSFLSRFTLDRKLTDLNESIVRQKNTILSYKEVENKFLNTQANLDFLKNQQATSASITNALEYFEKNLPIDVKLDKLAIQPNSWSVSAIALSAEAMKSVVDHAIKTYPNAEVSIGKVELDSRTGYIKFDVKIDFSQKNDVKVKTNRAKNE